jgi:hypothetical protein
MNRIHIDRLDLSFSGLALPAARAVEAALPGAIQSRLTQRLTQRMGQRIDQQIGREGAGPAADVLARLHAADLGTLDVSTRQDPRAMADAIALRLADWLDSQLDTATPATLEP